MSIMGSNDGGITPCIIKSFRDVFFFKNGGANIPKFNHSTNLVRSMLYSMSERMKGGYHDSG